MRLAIADPPYLGRSVRWYGGGRGSYKGDGIRADVHDAAADFDRPQRHVELVEQLVAEYDGFAIAMARDSLETYLTACPSDVHVGIWHRPNAAPDGSRIRTAWEPVVFYVPKPRRGRAAGLAVSDVLTEG